VSVSKISRHHWPHLRYANHRWLAALLLSFAALSCRAPSPAPQSNGDELSTAKEESEDASAPAPASAQVIEENPVAASQAREARRHRPGPLDYRPGLQFSDLVDLSWLVRAQAGAEKQVSSYDRSGLNDDGFKGTYSYLRRDENGEYVIMESDLPGVINQLWFTWRAEDGLSSRMRFYFDGEKTPRVDLTVQEFFSGEHFPFVKPLVVDMKTSSGGASSHMPMPYASSVRVTTTEPIYFYHIDYRTFIDESGIVTFDPKALQAETGPFAETLQSLRRTSYAPDTTKAETTTVAIAPGREEVLLEVEGGATIRGWRLNLAELHDPRQAILRFYYEHLAAPSVEVSIGDLYGQTFADRAIRSLPLGLDEAGYYLNFPIPFLEHLRVTLENRSGAAIEASFAANVERKKPPTDFVYFHARWTKAETQAAVPFTYLQTSGRGHFCGVVAPMQGMMNLLYLEGDERIYVDGEGIPSFHGTGTEDYYLAGWYFDQGAFDLPYHGLTYIDEDRGQTAPYRFHTIDSIPFRYNMRFEIEHGSRNNYPGATYGSVALWYQDPPIAASTSLTTDATKLDASAFAYPRIGIPRRSPYFSAAKFLDKKQSSPEVEMREWDALDVKWTGGTQTYLPKEGTIALTIPLAVDDVYELTTTLGRGPDHGIVELALGDQRASFDAYSPVLDVNVPGPTLTAALDRQHSTLETTVRTKNAASSGTAHGIDRLRIRPVGGLFVDRWLAIGPFDNTGDRFFDYSYPPEKLFARKATYTSKDQRKIAWRNVSSDANGYTDLVDPKYAASASSSITYARTSIYSEGERNANLSVGADAGIQVWLNDKLIVYQHRHDPAQPDQSWTRIPLVAGWNHFLVKVDNPAGGTGFYFRISRYPGLRWDPEAAALNSSK
jgi:hypothetical protein